MELGWTRQCFFHVARPLASSRMCGKVTRDPANWRDCNRGRERNAASIRPSSLCNARTIVPSCPPYRALPRPNKVSCRSAYRLRHCHPQPAVSAPPCLDFTNAAARLRNDWAHRCRSRDIVLVLFALCRAERPATQTFAGTVCRFLESGSNKLRDLFENRVEIGAAISEGAPPALSALGLGRNPLALPVSHTRFAASKTRVRC